jgi:hypothetical protein
LAVSEVQDLDPEGVGLVWMDGEGASIVRWDGEPVVERIESGVPPNRPAAGSVRRGPARPSGGGRVPGHGSEGRHLEEMGRYLGDLAEKLADLDAVEISGRGRPHEQLAELLERLAQRSGEPFQVTTRSLSRKPTNRQLMARLRELVGRELPRRPVGSYPGSGPVPADPEATTQRPRRPRHLPEQREIGFEVQMMLSGEQPRW